MWSNLPFFILQFFKRGSLVTDKNGKPKLIKTGGLFLVDEYDRVICKIVDRDYVKYKKFHNHVVSLNEISFHRRNGKRVDYFKLPKKVIITAYYHHIETEEDNGKE